MKTTHSIYRSAALFLAILFLIFNIGLPVIVASCPMVKNSHPPTCGLCLPSSDRGAQHFVKYVDRSCCATVIAAGRNTNEFVKAGNETGQNSPSVFLLFAHSVIVPQTLSASWLVINSSPPPPPCEDIPIFISSLLI